MGGPLKHIVQSYQYYCYCHHGYNDTMTVLQDHDMIITMIVIIIQQ